MRTPRTGTSSRLDLIGTCIFFGGVFSIDVSPDLRGSKQSDSWGDRRKCPSDLTEFAISELS